MHLDYSCKGLGSDAHLFFVSSKKSGLMFGGIQEKIYLCNVI